VSSAIVHDTIWTGRMARELRRYETACTPRDLMFYLITGPEKNPYGLFLLEPDVLERRLAGTERDFAAAMRVLVDEHFCQFDERSGWVWVVEMAFYQFPGSPMKAADYRSLSIKKWYQNAPRNVFLGPWFDRYVTDFALAAEPKPVERRDYIPFSQKGPSIAPITPPGGAPLSTVQIPKDLSFDLKTEETQPLLFVDPAQRPLKDDALEEAFEALWVLYPNGKQKKDARLEFVKLKPTPAFVATLRASIEANKTTRDWTKDAGQFVPRMVNWLKKRGWEDRIVAAPPVVTERTSATLRAASNFARQFGSDE
jgi:hypothetical protein